MPLRGKDAAKKEGAPQDVQQKRGRREVIVEGAADSALGEGKKGTRIGRQLNRLKKRYVSTF